MAALRKSKPKKKSPTPQKARVARAQSRLKAQASAKARSNVDERVKAEARLQSNQRPKSKATALSQELEKSIKSDHLANIWDSCQMPSRQVVARLHDQMLSVLFPGVFGLEEVLEADLSDFLASTLTALEVDLARAICMTLDYAALIGGPASVQCGQGLPAATSLTQQLISTLPRIRGLLGEDLQAAYEGDPAATSVGEVLLSYPFVQAIASQRIAHALYHLHVPLLPRMLTEVAHSRTGIDIHPGAQIGPGFFIDHGTGVVIGETTVIGRGVKIYQGVTLGALSFPKDENGNPIKGIKRHPNIEDGVTLYAGATVLGGKTTIGKGSVIGGNCWITKSVAAGSRIFNEVARQTPVRGNGPGEASAS